MSKLCLSTYMTVLKMGMASSCTNKKLVGNLMRIIYGPFDDTDDQKINGLINGWKNISLEIADVLETLEYEEVAKEFEVTIKPLLNMNMIGKIENALIDIISRDETILDDTIIDLVANSSKMDLIEGRYENSFLVGLFLYALRYTKNRNTNVYVKEITTEYWSGVAFERRIKKEKTTVQHECSEKARQFCIEHEEERSLLPLCQMAMKLNPLHNHHRKMFNDFNILSEEIQHEIFLISNVCEVQFEDGWLDKYICMFEDDIEKYKLSSRKFLYDGAKYMTAAIHYSDKKWEDMNPYIFPRAYTLKTFGDLKASLSDYIYDYMEGETIDGESMAVPMDLLWEAFNLGGCKEEMMTFWVNRFVLSTCYCLSNSDVRSEEKADFVEETCFESLEDLYYAAVLGLCVTYQY